MSSKFYIWHVSTTDTWIRNYVYVVENTKKWVLFCKDFGEVIIKKSKSKLTPRPRDSKIMKYENAKSLKARLLNMQWFWIQNFLEYD